MEQLQHFNVPISAAERFELFAFLQEDRTQQMVPIMNREEGKTYRRMYAAFGLVPIRETVMARQRQLQGRDGDLVSRTQVLAAPRLFSITIENLTALSRFDSVAWNANREMLLGELFDRLRDASKGGAEPEWLAMSPYDPAEEHWAPPEGE